MKTLLAALALTVPYGAGLATDYPTDLKVVATTDGRVYLANVLAGPQGGCYPPYGFGRPYGATYSTCAPVYAPPAGYVQQAVCHDAGYVTQKVVAQDYCAQPLIVAVPVQPAFLNVQATGSPYYYSVSQAYNEKAYLRDVLREELARAGISAYPSPGGGYTPNAISGSTGQSAYPGNSAVTAPARPAPPAAPARPDAGAVRPDARTPKDLQDKVIAAYKGRANCLGCHGDQVAPAKGAGFVLAIAQGDGFVLADQASDKRWKIYGMASVGAMPPTAVTDANKAMETNHLPALLQYAAIRD